MIQKKETETFYPTSRQAWRQWLQENHESAQAVWLLQYKKAAGKPTISWSEAVDEALCFGWIDSIRKTVDDEKFIQFFSKRKPAGTWSKINKDKLNLLMGAGLVAPAGLATIAAAKQNGSWKMLDEVETLKIPKDLAAAFKAYPGSKKYFASLSKSVKKMMLQWILFAKRPETREKRINEIALLASQQLKPKQF